MAEISFFVLPQADADARYRFACRLAEKVFRQGGQAYIHTADAQEAAAVDELLWQFRPESFVPHARLDALRQEHWPDTPIAIGWSGDPGTYRDALINLAPDVPSFFDRFARVSEIVIQSPEVLQRTRQNYRFYQERGESPATHRL